MTIGGESYLDVKERCHRVLMKLVGSRDSILVVAHKAVIRVIMSYFLDKPGEEIPNIPVEMHTVYELEPTAYCTNSKTYDFSRHSCSVCYKKIMRIFLRNSLVVYNIINFKAMNFEKIALEVFPELDQDLVPYVASIVEENKTASASELADILTPILTGYDVVAEEEISNRCKKFPPLLNKGKKRKPYTYQWSIMLVAL